MKKKVSVYLTEEQKKRLENAAAHTNRTLSQFLTEAGEQFVNRYIKRKTDSIEHRLWELQKEIEELYNTVRE